MERATARIGPTNTTQGSFHMMGLPAFDLSVVMARVSREHADWSPDRLAQAELDYRAYLAKGKLDGSVKHIPSKDVDEVWHAHILFTKQYHRDCDDYFGFYFHHVPFEPSDGKSATCGMACNNDITRH